MIGVYAILGVSEHGWGSAQTLILCAVSVALGAAFIARQARIENPLMPLRLFHSRNVVGANLIQAFLVAGMFGMFFLGALYLQRILGYDALQVGLAFLPTTLVMGTMSLGFSEKLIMRFGPRTTLIPGVIMVGIGLLLFARTPVDGNYLTDLLAPLLLVGLGVGTSFPSLMTLAMSGATPEDSGLASGVVSTSMQVGGAIGLAVLATLAAQRTDNKLADGAGQLARAQLRLPPRLRDRRDPGRGGDGDRRHRPARSADALAGGDGGDAGAVRRLSASPPTPRPNKGEGRTRARRAARPLGRPASRSSSTSTQTPGATGLSLPDLSGATFEEAALHWVGVEGQGALVGRCRLLVAAEAPEQVGAGAVQRLVVVELLLDRARSARGPACGPSPSPPRRPG